MAKKKHSDEKCCLVEMRPRCYVGVDIEDENGQPGRKIYSGSSEKITKPDGKKYLVWHGDRFWCTEAKFRSYTSESDPARPLVQLIERREASKEKDSDAK